MLGNNSGYVQFHPQASSRPLPGRLFAHTTSATESNANKPTIAAFSTTAAYEMLSYT